MDSPIICQPSPPNHCCGATRMDEAAVLAPEAHTYGGAVNPRGNYEVGFF